MTHRRSPSETADKVTRAIDLMNAYGADPRRWPADEAALFDALESDPRFQAVRQDAAALDAALRSAPDAVCTEALKTSILSRFPEGTVRRTLIDAAVRRCTHGLGRLAPISAAAGLSALGFVIGAMSAGVGASEDEALYYALDTSIIEIAEGDAFWADDL